MQKRDFFLVHKVKNVHKVSVHADGDHAGESVRMLHSDAVSEVNIDQW